MLSANPSSVYEIYHNNPYNEESAPYCLTVADDALEANAIARFSRKRYDSPNYGVACPAKYPNGALLRKALRIS